MYFISSLFIGSILETYLLCGFLSTGFHFVTANSAHLYLQHRARCAAPRHKRKDALNFNILRCRNLYTKRYVSWSGHVRIEPWLKVWSCFSGKDVLFSDDWREDVARLEERLSQLEEELNRRYQPQRGFSNTGYQGYRNPPRTGRTQLSRSPTNLISGNQYEGMGGYAKSPFNDFFPQRSPPSYDNTMRRHSQTPLSQRPNGPNPNLNNPGRKPTSNSKKQRGQEPMSANRLPLPPPAPIPNPPPISPPIVADPKSRNTDEMEFVRSSKSNLNN